MLLGAGSRILSLRTFIFAYVLEGEGEVGIFSFDDSDLAKSTSTDDS